MSLVVSSLSGGNMLQTTGTPAATGGTTAVTGTATAAGGGTTALPFAQTLVQSMGGSVAKGTETPLLGNLASLLQGLLNAVQSTGETTGTSDDVKSADLLKGIAEDVEKLDESISADPALLAALQGWLLQVSALLSGSNAAGAVSANEGSTDTAAMSPLAQNPETIRFAVQDELNSLVSMIQQAAVSGDEGSAAKGAELLNNFSALLAETVSTDNKVKTRGTNITDTAAASSKQLSGIETGGKSQAVDKEVPVLVNPSAKTAASQTEPSAAPAATVAEDGETEVISTPLTKAAVSADAQKAASTEDALPEVKTTADHNEVVTAGQMSIRDGMTAPLKAETAPVPVNQFAQRMETFITGKLEIVKKGGIAEAVITLFPENLGQVDVKITMQNGNLIAQFTTAHSGAKDMLEQQMSQLRAALQSQGLQVEKLEVTQNNTPLFSQFNGQQGRQQGSNGQQGGRSKDGSEDNGDALLAAELNGEWKEWLANSQQDNRNEGGSFSAKA